MSQFSFQPPFTEVVRHLIFINVLMFFGTQLAMGEGELAGDIGRYQLAAYMPGSYYFQPFQIATYMFMHGDIFHLLFNMLTLFMFGPVVEMVWGKKRFLFYYLSCGVGAYFCYMGVEWWSLSSNGQNPLLSSNPMLGASGAIFGILLAYGWLFPEREIQLIFPPVALKGKYYIIIIAYFEVVYGVQGIKDGVAHFAHLGGALTGLIILLFWYRFRFK